MISTTNKIQENFEANFQENFNIIKPVFLPGSTPDNLFSTNVYVGISIVAKSPLLTDSGNFQLVSFLGSLPKPSIIVLADELNRHNVKAMANLSKRKKMPSRLGQKVRISTSFHIWLLDLELRVQIVY